MCNNMCNDIADKFWLNIKSCTKRKKKKKKKEEEEKREYYILQSLKNYAGIRFRKCDKRKKIIIL